MKLYSKIFTSPKKYLIKYNAGKNSKIVSENQDLYQAWLGDGNTPDKVPYVLPINPEPSLEELRKQIISSIFTKRTTSLSSGFIFNGMPIDSTDESQKLILGGSRKANNNNKYSAIGILKDGTLHEFTNQELKNLEVAFDNFGSGIQDVCISEYTTALTANKTQLKYYKEHGEFQ